MKMSVYLAEDSIRLVVGVMKKRLYIQDCKTYRLHTGTLINNVITDEEQVRSVLKQISREYSPYAGNVNLVLGSSKIITKVLPVPIMGRRALLELTRRELAGFADPDKDMVYDYSTISCKNETRGGGTILCAAVERPVIQEYMELFADCGLRIKSIDTSLNAAAQLLGAMTELRGKTFVFSNLDGRNMISILYIGGDYSYTSRIRLLSDRDSDEIWEEIEKELHSILLFQKTRHAEYELSSVYISGITEKERRGMVPKLSMRMGLTILFPEKTDRIETAPGCDYQIGNYVYASGSMFRT